MEHPEFLILVDHDGTLCQTSHTAYDSLKYAMEHAIRAVGEVQKFIDLDSIMSRLTGTTEKRLVRELISIFQIDTSKQELFESAFYVGRANWYRNMKTNAEFIFDTYFPDMEFLIQKASRIPSYHFGLVTGNPKPVIEERISPHIKDIFSQNGQLFGSFGEDSISRTQLILQAIQKAKLVFPTFSPTINQNGFATNVVYIGDSQADLSAGLKAKVKTIFVPSRSLQNVKFIKHEECYILLGEIFEDSMLITNDCSSPETFQFIGLP